MKLGAHTLTVEVSDAAGAGGEIAEQAMRGATAEPGASVIVERRWYGARGGGRRRAATLIADARGAFAPRVPATAQQCASGSSGPRARPSTSSRACG